jgi:hypothetical protein
MTAFGYNASAQTGWTSWAKGLNLSGMVEGHQKYGLQGTGLGVTAPPDSAGVTVGCGHDMGRKEWDREVMGTCQRPHRLAGGVPAENSPA